MNAMKFRKQLVAALVIGMTVSGVCAVEAQAQVGTPNWMLVDASVRPLAMQLGNRIKTDVADALSAADAGQKTSEAISAVLAGVLPADVHAAILGVKSQVAALVPAAYVEAVLAALDAADQKAVAELEPGSINDAPGGPTPFDSPSFSGGGGGGSSILHP